MDIELFINITFLVLCGVTIAWTGVAFTKLIKLKARFNAAIVLIPLYKRNNWTIAAMVLIAIVLVIDAILMYLYPYYIILTISIMVICITMLILLSFMLSLRCAVLDSGVVVPFRYIDWTHLYDYHVEGNTIFFSGDDKGFDSLSAVTTKLKFDKSNIEKLHYVLSKHKKV